MGFRNIILTGLLAWFLCGTLMVRGDEEICGELSTDSRTDFVQAHYVFALDLYRAVVEISGEDENLAFSPSSIAAAFAMLEEISTGTSQNEIVDAFPRCSHGMCVRPGYSWYMTTMFDEKNSSSQVRSVNGVLTDIDSKEESEDTDKALLEIVESCYAAELDSVDLDGDIESPTAAEEEPPKKVAHEKLTVVTLSDAISGKPNLVLFNDLLFEADWLLPFSDGGKVFFGNFYPKFDYSQPQKTRYMILQKQALFYVDNEVRVVGLPYSNNKHTMYFFVPRGFKSLKKLEDKLMTNRTRLREVMDSVLYQNVSVVIPKFTLTYEIGLEKVMAKLNVEAVFSKTEAEFNLASEDRENLYVSSAFHTATIEVNELGTETALAVPKKSAYCTLGDDAPVFWGNVPFMFLIFDGETETILFMGRITNAASLNYTRTNPTRK